ncbi:MAG: HAD family hydrolase [Alphaproteobacteria bacterium]
MISIPNAENIRGLLFDKDGTLILFEESWKPVILDAVEQLSGGDKQLARKMLEASGFDTVNQTFVAGGLLAGATDVEIIECWAQFVPMPSEEELKALQQHILETQVAVPVEGLVPCLERLKADGYILGVATNDVEVVARANLKQLGISHLFDFVAGADSGFGSKPEPGMLQAFCEEVGLKPSEVAMMGDNWQDIAMARNGKVGLAVGVLTGTTTADELTKLADVVLPSIVDL